VYIDDLNIISNQQDIDEACKHLKTEFELKDLGKTKFCLGLQLEHLSTRIFVHQSAYVQKGLEKFNMDKAYPSKISMVIRSLEIKTDPFRSPDEGEKTLGPQVPYLSAIEALMYLANSTRPDNCIHSELASKTQCYSYQKTLDRSKTDPQLCEWHKRSWTILQKGPKFRCGWIH
jgi:hypothetical protein